MKAIQEHENTDTWETNEHKTQTLGKQMNIKHDKRKLMSIDT